MPNKNKVFENAYTNAYTLADSILYSKPKIYNANNDLKKRWYVYFYFKNPATQKMTLQSPIYLGVNKFKTIAERTKAIKRLREAVENVLINGYNPYQDEHFQIDEKQNLSVKAAADFVLKIKKNQLKETSFKDFKSRVNRFVDYLLDNGFAGRYISSVNRKTITTYLNHVQEDSSAANRNNTQNNLSVMFAVLVDNEIIPHNPFANIKKLKTTPERNKTYSDTQVADIYKHLETHDRELLLFIMFVTYNYLRPIEVCRLKIQDINLTDNLLFVRAKNKAVKTKIIPNIMLSALPNVATLETTAYLFTPDGYGQPCQTSDVDRRNYWTKRFKKEVKDKFKLSAEFTIYSFRHYGIGKLYQSFIQDITPFEAKSRMMLITGHTSMTSLEKYLRNIDATLPEDYSHRFK